MDDKEKIQVLSALVARSQLLGQLGMSYGTDRNMYETLGYPSDVSLTDYYTQYIRQDIAKAIIDRPSATTWSGEILLLESREKDETPAEEAWKELCNRLMLKNKFQRLDRLTCLSTYGVFLLGLSDVKSSEGFERPVTGKNLELLYVKPFDALDAEILAYETNSNNPRYGMPLLYSITVSTPNKQSSQVLRVHHSRVIHVVWDALKDEIVGTPLLLSVFNRLKDLEKLIGGSAEMFWRGARPGYQGKIDPDYQMTDTMQENLKDQIDEYEHNLRRIIVNEGMSLDALASQVADPTNHVDVQIQMISAVTGIPKRILTGSERGELSSAQDQAQWYGLISERRKEFAEPKILRPFIDKCIEYGVLPSPTEDYSIQWEDIFTTSDKAKADVGHVRSMALTQYASQPLAAAVVPPQAFFEFFLGLTQEQIELINQMVENDVDMELRELMMNPEQQGGSPSNDGNDPVDDDKTEIKTK